MNKIMFPKNVITRKPEIDFSDDGTQFRGYIYKGTVPITYARYRDEVYAAIRLDYVMAYNDYRDSGINSDICNGISASRFDMVKFLDECEKAYQFVNNYNLPEAQKECLTKKLEDVNSKIAALNDLREKYMVELEKLNVAA